MAGDPRSTYVVSGALHIQRLGKKQRYDFNIAFPLHFLDGPAAAAALNLIQNGRLFCRKRTVTPLQIQQDLENLTALLRRRDTVMLPHSCLLPNRIWVPHKE